MAASLATLVAAITLATFPAAKAGGFALREHSAYGQGMSFAGVAAGGSLSSMFWNPATLSQVVGLEFETGIAGVRTARSQFPRDDGLPKPYPGPNGGNESGAAWGQAPL